MGNVAGLVSCVAGATFVAVILVSRRSDGLKFAAALWNEFNAWQRILFVLSVIFLGCGFILIGATPRGDQHAAIESPIPARVVEVLDRAVVDGYLPLEDMGYLNDWLNTRYRQSPRQIEMVSTEIPVILPQEIGVALKGGVKSLSREDREILLKWLVNSVDPIVVRQDLDSKPKTQVDFNVTGHSPVVWRILRRAALGKTLTDNERADLVKLSSGYMQSRITNPGATLDHPYLGNVTNADGSRAVAVPMLAPRSVESAPAPAPAPPAEKSN